MYALMNIVGPILLLAVLMYFALRQWRSRPREIEQAERGARELRNQLNKEDTGVS